MYRRRRYFRRRLTGRQALGAAAVGLVLAFAARSGAGAGVASTHTAPAGSAAAKAVAYAQAQLGKPYLWGGTGPDAYDCSGLVYEAYLGADVRGIPRTSSDQWAWGPQVTNPQAGDLVFFAGGDGTWASPGHVGIVIDPAHHLMIEAYATGYPIRISVYGLPNAPPGDEQVVGFTAPWERAGAA